MKISHNFEHGQKVEYLRQSGFVYIGAVDSEMCILLNPNKDPIKVAVEYVSEPRSMYLNLMHAGGLVYYTGSKDPMKSTAILYNSPQEADEDAHAGRTHRIELTSDILENGRLI